MKMNLLVSDLISFYPLILAMLIAIWLLVNGIIAYYVYKDAQVNDSYNATIWGIVVFFSSAFGLIMYLITRSGNKTKRPTNPTSILGTEPIIKYCSNCMTQNEKDSKYCSNCGNLIR